MACWATSPFQKDASLRRIFADELEGVAGDGGHSPGGDDGLGASLAAIAEEVHRHAAAARHGVLADFAARASHARKHLSRPLLAAALASIKEQRKAVLVLITRNAAAELASRKHALICAASSHAKRPRKPGRKGSSSDHQPARR